MPITIEYDGGQLGGMPAPKAPFTVEMHEILGAAVGVGIHPGFNPAGRGRGVAFDAGWRIQLIQALIDASAGHIRQSPLYAEELEPTEKGFASYHLGMTFAYLWAYKLLGTTYLGHIDRFLIAAGQRLDGTRPDLLGTGHGGVPYAIEAKGRSGALGDAITTGKKQITHSDWWFAFNADPAVGMVIAAYFPGGGPLRMRIRDPLSTAPMYPVDQATLRAVAVEPFAEAISTQPERRVDLPDGMVGAEVGGTGVIVALAPSAQAALELPPRRPPTQQQVVERFVSLSPWEQREAEPRQTAEGLEIATAPPGFERYRDIGTQLEPAEPRRIEDEDLHGVVMRSGAVILTERGVRQDE